MARVLLLARYGALGASSRVRSLQFLPCLEQHGLEVDVASLFDDDYVTRLYDGRRPRWTSVAASYGRRVLQLLARGRYDVVWVEKELFPWLPAWADLALLRGGARLLVDYDDAVFHRYDAHRRGFVRRMLGGKIDAVMRAADVVVVGNAYLGARAQAAGARRVELLPTVVDTERYAPSARAPGAPFTLGWIGTPRTARYLRPIAPVLAEVAAATSARLVLIGAGPEALAGVAGVEARPWSEDTEVGHLQGVDAGLMPLPDRPFERGKCGYKLVQFMACGKPVVASPVGVNAELVEHGATGFLADSPGQWREALLALAGDPQLCARLGAAGRRKVEAELSVAAIGPRLAGLLCELGAGRGRRAVGA